MTGSSGQAKGERQPRRGRQCVIAKIAGSVMRRGHRDPVAPVMGDGTMTATALRWRSELRYPTSGPVIGNINKEKKDDKAFNFTQEHLNASVPL